MNELIAAEYARLDREITKSAERVIAGWSQMRGHILNGGMTADRAHERVTRQMQLTADEQGAMSRYYYAWCARR
jgi:hypothetical protein